MNIKVRSPTIEKSAIDRVGDRPLTSTTIRELAQNWCLTVRAIDLFALTLAP